MPPFGLPAPFTARHGDRAGGPPPRLAAAEERIAQGRWAALPPSVLFLDEPTTGLDPQARAMMWREIARLTADGLTVVLTTHYLEEADRLAARIAIIRDGQLVVEGSPEALRGELRGDTVELELAAPDQPGGLDRADGPDRTRRRPVSRSSDAAGEGVTGLLDRRVDGGVDGGVVDLAGARHGDPPGRGVDVDRAHGGQP